MSLLVRSNCSTGFVVLLNNGRIFFSQSEFAIVNKVQVIQFASRATSQANKSLPHAFADICATWVNNTIKKNNTL